MELGQNRVWDYVGDNFVHRLMQTDSADGKLVEAEGTGYANCKGGVDGVPVCHDEKMDSIQLEYTYLLTSQLESQRRYFEEKMTRVETSAQREIDEMVNQTRLQAEDAKEMKDKVENLTKEKAKSEQRLSTALSRIVKLQEDLKEEKQMNENLLHNQKAWQKKFNDMQQNMNDLRKEKDCEITDLKVMFFQYSIFLLSFNILCDFRNKFEM